MPENPDGYYITRPEQDRLLAKLVTLADWLAEALDAAATRQTVHPAGPRGRRAKRGATEDDSTLPFNEHVSQIAADLASTLNAWVTHTSTKRTFTHPGRLDVKGAARWLGTRRHVTALALTEDAPAAYDEILYAIGRALGAIDRPPLPNYVGACGKCDGDLWARRDDPTIRCRICGWTIARAENDDRIETALRDRLFTARELVDIVDARLGLTVKPKAIHELTRRRRPLEARGQTRRGETLYRCGDVLDALTPRPRRRTRRADR